MALTFDGHVFSKISFCDKQCDNVNNDKLKSEIIKSIDTKHKIQVITRDYNMINPNIFRNVTYHQHILSTYTNGNPYMLYLTKIDGVNHSIFIDKKLKDGYTYPKIHFVQYRFDDKLYEKDTIFTGELVRDLERRWFFLIDNILIYKGLSTSEKNIISKYELIHNILNEEYKDDKYLEICPLQIKKLFLYKDIKLLINEFIPNLSYKCKGLIFYTLNTKNSNYAYLVPRDCQIEIKSSSEIEDLIKEKNPELLENTISNIDNYNNINFDDINNINNDININNHIDNHIDNLKESNIDINNVSNSSNSSNTSIIELNNVVFKIFKNEMPDIYNLYCLDDSNNLIKHSIALVPNIKISHLLYNTFISNQNNFNIKVECKYSKVFSKWTPFKIVENEPYNKKQILEIEEILKI